MRDFRNAFAPAALALFTAAALALSGCGGSGDTAGDTDAAISKPPPGETAGDTAASTSGTSGATSAPGGTAESGAAIFAANCQSCHGANGAGKPGMGPSFAEASHDPDSELRETIVNGKDNGKMPSFKGKLTDTQIDAVLAHVKQLGAALPHEH